MQCQGLSFAVQQEDAAVAGRAGKKQCSCCSPSLSLFKKKKKKSREGEKKKIFTCYQKISMLPYLKLKENCCSVWGEKREVVKVASPQPDVSSNT